MHFKTLIPAAAILLTACANDSGPAPGPPAPDACHANELQRYLKALPTPDVMASIAAVAGEGKIRTIRPGDAVTMDFRENRLNVELGEDGRIKRLRCG